MNARAHIFLSGRVQGVNFRGYTHRWAKELSLGGWVRNLYDGRVEVIAEGEKTNVEALIDRIKGGPSRARIESMDVRWEEFSAEFQEFRIAWTDF
jgi:acylphosphatase